jgi:hypothetical protein
MSKNVATIEAINLSELIAKLSEIGFELSNPETGRITGFTSFGDEINLIASDVAAFLIDGNGLLLWRGHAESLYASVSSGKPRIYFDGFTAMEEEALCSSLLQLGINFSVAHEDLADEG